MFFEVHCAQGIGRSACLLTACLVKARLAQDVWEAFLLIKRNRPVAHVNAKMKQALTAWERKYNLKVED